MFCFFGGRRKKDEKSLKSTLFIDLIVIIGIIFIK